MSTPSQPFKNDEALAQEMEAYLLGTLTDEQIDAFEARLLDNPSAANLCAEAIEAVAMTREVFRDDQEQRAVLDRDQTLQGFHELLAELCEAEDRAETQLVHLVGQVKTRRPLWQQWPVVIPSAMAALLAIAVILIVTLPTNTPPTSTLDLAQSPDAPDVSTPIAKSVAILTATHNAQWADTPAQRALARGSELKAGQRLALTAGFAEVTTARGAVVILQAPVTIELLDNDNALRLHTGKLVGICETESSKGFLVRTPHMDVTDLGTRFGVDASTPDLTEAHVLEGEVEVTRQSSPDAPAVVEQLSAGQAVRATRQDQGLTRIRSIAPAFVTAMPGRYLPEGTGFGLANGAIDPNWRVVAIDGQPVTEGGEMQVIYPRYGDSASSRWLLVPKKLLRQDASDRTITCRGSLQLPPGFDAHASQLVLGFNADFIVTGIRVNGKEIDVPENELNREAPLTEILIQSHAVPGINTIEFDIYDRDNHSALRAAFEVRPMTP